MSNLGNGVTKESQVSGEMDHLSKSIDELGAVLGNIVNRIEPILYHSPEVSEKEDLPIQALCEFLHVELTHDKVVARSKTI